MTDRKYNVGIIGCGMILDRHLEAIRENDNFSLVALCDTDESKYTTDLSFLCDRFYKNYKEMLLKEDINFVVIATPNNLHYEQAIYSLENSCDVLIEKPATIDPSLLKNIKETAENNSQRAYCVLQVRLNPVVQKIKYYLDNNLLGKIRGISLVQRWQRPKEYFDDWRGEPKIGGGILHECGIHYLDILCYLVGAPRVCYTKLYNTKHLNIDIEDTVYSVVDFGNFGGTIEVTISSEPRNIECSLSFLTDKGFFEIGGKALNKIEKFNFLDVSLESTDTQEHRIPNSYKTYQGSCPNHPDLYRQIENFDISETFGVIGLIDEIYKKTNKLYY